MRQIHFFSTPSDIKPVLRCFEQNAPLQYAQHGKRAEPTRRVYKSYKDIPDLGLATHGTGLFSPGYIVAFRDTKYIVYAFKNSNGDPRWFLMHGDNEDTVLLTVAGIWETGTLLPGVMSTPHLTTAAQTLMAWFLEALRQAGFCEIGEFWLGIEAMNMLRSGRRLTMAEQSPREFDFRLPDAMR